MDVDQTMCNEFLAEARDHLKNMEEELLVLEKKPDSDRISTIFRAIHSIKGGAGFLGFFKINDLSHIMENILQLMRNGSIQPESKYIDALLSGVDIINQMLDDVFNSNETDIKKIMDLLTRLLNGEEPNESPKETSKKPSKPVSSKKEKKKPKKLTNNNKQISQPKDNSNIINTSKTNNNPKKSNNKDTDIPKIKAKTQSNNESNSQINTKPNDPPKEMPIPLKIDSNIFKKIPSMHDLYIFQYDLYALENEHGISPMELVNKLLNIGTIMDAKLVSTADITQELSDSPLNYYVLFSSILDPEVIHMGAELPMSNIQYITKDEDGNVTILPLEKVNGNLIKKKEAAQELNSDSNQDENEYISDISMDDDIEKEENEDDEIIDDENDGEMNKDDGDEENEDENEENENEDENEDEDEDEDEESTDSDEREQERNEEEDNEPNSDDLDNSLYDISQSKNRANQFNAHNNPEDTNLPSRMNDDLFQKKGARSETIRVDVDILDQLMTLAGELILVRNRQLLCVNESDAVAMETAQHLDLVTSELQETIMRTRMQPIGNVFAKLPRIVRDLSKKLNKSIEITMHGKEVELDKSILELLADPMTHLIRNCCDHGIESPTERRRVGKQVTGQIAVKAYHEAGQINIRIVDDGRGIDPEKIKAKALKSSLKTKAELDAMNEKEILSLVTMSGLSTAERVSEVSGRGVGMDVVQKAIEHLGGSLELESNVGEFTTVHLRLPLTLAIIPCLVVAVEEHRFAIPQVNLEELVCLYDEDIYTKIEIAGNQEVYRLRGKLLPMVRLKEILNRVDHGDKESRTEITDKHRKIKNLEINDSNKKRKSLTFAVVKIGTKRFGIIVDRVIGTEEIVVKPMHSATKILNIYSGATVMGDGRVALILDIEGIARHEKIRHSKELEEELTGEGKTIDNVKIEKQTVLLLKSGPNEQFAVPLPLIKRIERINVSHIEKVGQKEMIVIDGIETLIIRLDRIFDVSVCQENNEMFLLLPKHIKKPFGILMSQVVDISETPLRLNAETCMQDGLLGTAIINKKITLFLDIYRLIERVEPEWFSERRHASPPPKEKRRILLVEDSIFLRQLEKRYLESDGYEVIIAENGRQGLEVLDEFDFDLIVSDIEMPIMDGWEFMKSVRKIKAYKKIPSIAVTSLDSPEVAERAKKIGFNAYQVKIDREALLTEVSELLSQSEVLHKKYAGQEDDDNAVMVISKNIRQFCTFYISDLLFGVDIIDVKEINSCVEITPIFHASREMRGYVNIRGEIHLVIDLRMLLGFESKSMDDASRIVLFKHDVDESFGILVDRIGDVVEVDEANIEENMDDQKGTQDHDRRVLESELIQSVCKLEDTLLVILDARKVLKRMNKPN